MSAPPAARAPGRRPPGRWRQRWHRVVIPFAVLGLLVGTTLLARHLNEPDLGDPATLAPTGTGPDGSSRLAALLTERGVAIEPVDTLEAAQAALRRDDAVLFMPKPTVFGAWLVNLTAYRESGHRVVLVAPDRYQLAITGLPVVPGPQRWATRAASPRCTVPVAVAAGVASAHRHRYLVEDPADVCYGGGLVRVQVAGPEVYLVGSSDPFRNRRIGEHHNERLALELLGSHDRVVWAGALPTEVEPPPSLQRPERPPVDRTPSDAFRQLLIGYPPGMLAGFALLLVSAVLVALARARRLGPPVSEPLPVVVPAVEAVVGRGRLYHRTRGRAVALSALRAAALTRLVPALGLPVAPPPEPATMVSAAAARAGQPVAQVHHILYGPEPADDEQLARAVTALDALVDTVTRDNPAAGGA